MNSKIVGAVVVVVVTSLAAGVPRASGQGRSSDAPNGDANSSWLNDTAFTLCERTREMESGGGTRKERLELLNAQYEIELAIVRRIEEATSSYPRTTEEKKQRDRELKGYFDALFRADCPPDREDLDLRKR